MTAREPWWFYIFSAIVIVASIVAIYMNPVQFDEAGWEPCAPDQHVIDVLDGHPVCGPEAPNAR